MVGSVCAFYCYTYTLNLLCKHTRLVSICAFDSYTFTLNLLCKHIRLVSVGMFEGYAYTLNLLCMRLYFIMYMSLRFVLMLFLFMLYVLQCPAVPSLSCPHVCCGMAVLTQRGVLCNQIICKNQHPVY